jgi:hypothetical protein
MKINGLAVAGKYLDFREFETGAATTPHDR